MHFSELNDMNHDQIEDLIGLDHEKLWKDKPSETVKPQ